MKKNFILIFSFMFLPVLTYANSGDKGVSMNPIENSDLAEEAQELPAKDVILPSVNNSSSIITIVKDIMTSVGHTFTVIGHAIVTFGDDGEETDNTIEKVGKHVGFFGNLLKRIGDLIRKI